jgi:hypothetical protein
MYKKAAVRPEVRVSVFIESELHERMRVEAARRNITQTQLASEALKSLLDRIEAKNKRTANQR